MIAKLKKKSALLVIDPQNYFMSGRYTRHLPNKIRGLIETDGTFDFVVFTKFVNSGKTGFSRILNWKKCMKGRDIEIVDELRSFSNAKNTFIKDTYSPFKKRRFVEFLKSRKIGTLYIAGTDTDACVLSTAMDAFDLGFCPIVLGKFCASHSGLARHRQALGLLGALIGKKSVVA